jgi:hypothetical protein
MKSKKGLSQNIRSVCRDLKQGPSEYEAVVLTTRPRRSVIKQMNFSDVICNESRRQ